MNLSRLAALVALLCLPALVDAQFTVQLADVQLAKSVGATIEDASGAPVPKAVVQEFSADWKAALRSTTTDTEGKFAFTPGPGKAIYFIQISTPEFDRCNSV